MMSPAKSAEATDWTYTGRVWKYGDGVNTDVIYPGVYLEVTDPHEMAKYAMTGQDDRLIKGVKTGDILVAGDNFGCGSSREHAPLALLEAGISVVVAASFARIFYRNSVNVGLPLLVCKGASALVQEGGRAEVNLRLGTFTNLDSGQSAHGCPVSDYELSLLAQGGAVAAFRASLQQ